MSILRNDLCMYMWKNRECCTKDSAKFCSGGCILNTDKSLHKYIINSKVISESDYELILNNILGVSNEDI